MSELRLHLGCGARYLPGWVHVDAQHFEHIDHQASIDNLSMFADNSVDEIYACHVLEHIPRTKILSTLAEWNRVMKPNAKVRIAVPDWDAVVTHCHTHPERLPEVMGLVTGGQRDDLDHHTFMFNFKLLSDMLEWCGFVKMCRYPWKSFLPAGYDDYSRCYLPHMDEKGRLMSLNMAARKASGVGKIEDLPFNVAVAVGLKKASEAPPLPPPPSVPKKKRQQPRVEIPRYQPKVDELVVGYQNFFSGFEERSPIAALMKHKLAKYTGISNVALVHAGRNSHLTFDVLLGGVSSGNLDRFSDLRGRVKFLWAQEHVARQGVSEKAIRTVPDFAVGYIRGVRSTPTSMRLPNWMFYWDFLYDDSKDLDVVLRAKPNLNGRKRRACFIARLKHGNTRTRMVQTLQSVIPTDCPGAVANNTGGKSIEKITGIKDRKLSKMTYIRDYLFNLCPENDDRHPGYVTEKLMQACVAGCIPIYWGHAIMEPGIINPRRVIQCANRASIGGKAADQVKRFLTNDEKLEEFFDQPVFLPTARERIIAIREEFNEIMKSLAARVMSAKR
jgi:predicted SAM-dependent methyltransferase